MQQTIVILTVIFYSSRTVGDNKLDVNIGMVYGMRAIGRGYSSLRRLRGYLDSPESMTVNNYDKLSKSIKAVTKNVAERSMLDASEELKGEMDTADVAVSVDGSWQLKKRHLLSEWG